ncbi:MAG: hypothetical protein H0X73_11470 [Chthoniobacterales bacterium]|nr:hypothetical protein [Chthoniobacterales bacterium]
MKHSIINSRHEENTYALLIRSGDKEQSISETVIYLLLIVCALFSMWFAAHQPVRMPVGTAIHTASAAKSPEALPRPV